MAAEMGSSSLVARLIEAGAEVNAHPAEIGRRTVLQAAAGKEELHLAIKLVNQRANVNGPPAKEGGRTALQAAAESGDPEMVRFLLDVGADPNEPACEVNGKTARQAAEDSKNIEVIQLLDDATRHRERGIIARRLIVCCDGTALYNDTDQPLSNVAKIALCFGEWDRREATHFTQVIHYQSGIGTSSFLWVKWYEQAFARGKPLEHLLASRKNSL
jgi:hypothetical protein